jgi:flagellar biosynthesis/type III secretory pathway chaperone
LKQQTSGKQETSTLFLLSGLGSLLDGLIDTAKEKQRLVVAGDCQGLEEIIRKEQQMLNDLDTLQERLGAEPLLVADDPESSEVQARLKGEVAEKVRRLQTINEQTQKLLAKSLEIVRFELGLFLPQDDYSKASKNPPIAFDQKA